MDALVLGRFELLNRIPAQEGFYAGAEVWTAKDHQAEQGRPSAEAKAILYPANSKYGTSTARALWSAELRKLFRLSCQPFDPALVGFITGGLDAPSQRFALFMAEPLLPSVVDWCAREQAGVACFKQWRGGQARQRSQAWQHIASLFRAVRAIHESRIVHRGITPQHLLVDEALPRDESGFLKLGRFEASAFVSAFANTISGTARQMHAWYAVEPRFGDSIGAAYGGVDSTFAGDVFGAMATALWLLTGCPTDDDLAIFETTGRSKGSAAAVALRRELLYTAIASLPTASEQSFFTVLAQVAFSPSTTSNAFFRVAHDISRDLRKAERSKNGPLCLVIADKLDRQLQQQWPDLFATGSTVHHLATLCSSAVMWPQEDRNTGAATNSQILLPNGLVLQCRIWQDVDGTRDWTRNYAHAASTHGSAFNTEPASLADVDVRVLYMRERRPPAAASWEPFFDTQSPEALDGPDPTAEALDYLNKAELSFWEANIVPVVVKRSRKHPADHGRLREYLDVVPLRDDHEFPPNPNIRNRPTPDFGQILQDKSPPIRVQLAPHSRLWDEATDRITYIEPNYIIGEVDTEQQRLHLRRDLRPRDGAIAQGYRAYLVTADQGWQMGLFRRRRNAIQSLARHAILSTVLVNPKARSVSVVPPQLNLPYGRWNEEKSTLVSKALSVAPLFLVEGPPGTGKSTFVSGLMRYILSADEDPAARILVVAQQHTAIDELHSRVQQMFGGDDEGFEWGKPILLRLSSRTKGNTEENEEGAILSPGVAARTIFEPCLATIRDRNEPEFILLRRWLKAELAAGTISPALEERLIEASSMIFTTCTDAYLDDISSTEFDWVIIEEAGRVVGTDLIIPMRLGHRWVLIGDPKQLGPYRGPDFDFAIRKTLQDAENAGALSTVDRRRLETDCTRLLNPFESFYSDLEASNQRYSLSVQHRMHPDIRRVVSNVFYEGALKDDPTTSGAMPYLFSGSAGFLCERSVVWLDVPHLSWPDVRRATVDEREKNGFSFCNLSEMNVIRELLTHLHVYESTRREASRIRVATITPYKYQLRALRELLRDNTDGIPPWLDAEGAFTATQYQGREADMIVLSMVRNNLAYETGFMDRYLMNVALSRAHRMLIVVGCFRMFEQRAENPHSGEEFVKRLVDEFRPYLVPAHKVFPEAAQ
jgi:hypothetical protein